MLCIKKPLILQFSVTWSGYRFLKQSYCLEKCAFEAPGFGGAGDLTEQINVYKRNAPEVAPAILKHKTQRLHTVTPKPFYNNTDNNICVTVGFIENKFLRFEAFWNGVNSRGQNLPKQSAI